MNNSQPSITVVIPMYNCEQYVQECLQSLKDQTFGDFEAICVNDASTDNTLEVAQSFTGSDLRFKFLDVEVNKGAAAARNKALDQALGKYLIFLDADDYLVPESFGLLFERAERQQLDDLYFSARSFYESFEAYQVLQEPYVQEHPFEGIGTGKEVFTYFDKRDQYYPNATLHFVKRSLIEENHIRFYEGIIHEDVLLTFQILLQAKRSSYLKEKLYMRRVRVNSITAQPKATISSVHSYFVCTQIMREWLIEHAAEVDDGFIEAMTHRIADFEYLAGREWYNGIDQKEQEDYIASLDPADKVRFHHDIIQLADRVNWAERVIHESTTYRVGDRLIRFPRKVKENREIRKNFKNEYRS